ncbi:membrane protein [Streptococcus suis]|uniref:membrane protein n=1 Tax=Streptococcus suis TaxID=1307 RepID=UPI000416BE85|nr:membrane protein [Streptococcus suis]HEM3186215.1 hypothetical protein [Streptococcus suis 89-2479]HEM3187405.1 hypothetical protein [Streptococcus suis 89-2479]
MLKKYAWPLASLILTGAIWFLTPASDPTWIKNSIFAGFLIYLLLLFLFISKLPKPDPDEPFYFGLSEKIYTVTLLAAMGIYGKGIWVITPATNPSWIKDVFLGFGLFLLMAFFLYFAFKKVDEKPDDRFYTNLAKAACLSLCLVLLSLMILTIITFFQPFTLTAGMILIFSATMILAFDFAFFFFENRGG